MKSSVSTSVISSAVICALLMVTGIALGGRLLQLIKTPAVLFADSLLYLNIYVWGLPFIFFYNIATGIFSALGDSKTPFWFLAVSSVSNIAVDILFVKQFNMGVAGVAWATFLCQGVSCVLSIIFVLLRLKGINNQEKIYIFSPEIFKEFIKIAVPSILQQSFISVGNIILQSVINGFGAGVMAGYSAAVKLNNLVITSFTTIGNGISNYAAQNIGAGKLSRIKEGYRAGNKLVWCICIPIIIAYMVFTNSLINFFIDSPSAEALRSAVLYLRIIVPFYFVVSTKLVADGILRGAGLMKQFMVSTFTDLILRVVLSEILSRTALGYVGIWCAWPIGWIMGTMVSVYFLKKSIWKSEKEKGEQHA